MWTLAEKDEQSARGLQVGQCGDIGCQGRGTRVTRIWDGGWGEITFGKGCTRSPVCQIFQSDDIQLCHEFCSRNYDQPANTEISQDDCSGHRAMRRHHRLLHDGYDCGGGDDRALPHVRTHLPPQWARHLLQALPLLPAFSGQARVHHLCHLRQNWEQPTTLQRELRQTRIHGDKAFCSNWFNCGCLVCFMSSSSFLIKSWRWKKKITSFYTNSFLQNRPHFVHCISVKFAQCWNPQSSLNELKIAWTGEDDQCWSCSGLKSDPSCPPQHISYGNGSWIWFPSTLIFYSCETFIEKINILWQR